MRKLIYFAMVSLDGFIDGPNGNDDWIIMDEELHRYLNELERETGVNLYGRRMFELMEAYWPSADTESDVDYLIEFSKIYKQIPKIVFSKTLDRVEGNARLVRGDPVEEVKRLKEEPGRDIEVGGAILASALMQAGLVDEYRIFVQPVILGGGTRIFMERDQMTKLRLVETHSFTSGVVYLRYQCFSGLEQ